LIDTVRLCASFNQLISPLEKRLWLCPRINCRQSVAGRKFTDSRAVNKEYAFGRRQEGVGAITTAYVECTLQIIGGTMIASPSASTYGVVLTFAI